MSDDCNNNFLIALFSFGTGVIFGYVSEKILKKYLKKNCNSSTNTETSYQNLNDN